MQRIRITLSMLLLGFTLGLFQGCGIKQQQEETTKPDAENTEVLLQIQNEKKALLEKANAGLTEINKKIMACNDKINSRKTRLTEAQNKALDEFEQQRASINQRIHQIKNVKPEDWETFKSTFETDLTDTSSKIEKILAEL